MLDSINEYDMYLESKIENIDGFNICYSEKGKGGTLLLLHGIPLSMISWRNVYLQLSDEFHVIAVDMPGFGKSDKHGSDYSLTFIATSLARFIKKIGVDKVTIIGSSFGAAVAATIALIEKSLVDRMILINSVGISGGTHSIEKIVRSNLMRYFIATALKNRSLGKSIFKSKLVKSYAKLKPTEDLIDQYYNLLLRNSGEVSFLRTLQQFKERELQSKLPQLVNEVLSIWGDRDDILPVKNSIKIQLCIKNCWSIVMQGSGHLPHEDNPTQFCEIVSKYLSMNQAT